MTIRNSLRRPTLSLIGVATAFALAAAAHAQSTKPSCAPEEAGNGCAVFKGCVTGGGRFDGRALGWGSGRYEVLTSDGSFCTGKYDWGASSVGQASGSCERDGVARSFNAEIWVLDAKAGLVGVAAFSEEDAFEGVVKFGRPTLADAPTQYPCDAPTS